MGPSGSDGFATHASAYLEAPTQLREEFGSQRFGQDKFLPGGVKSRALGDIIESSHAGLGHGASASITVPDGSSGTFTFTLNDDQGRTILAIPDTSWYIGSVTAANAWPNATYGMGNMPSTVWNSWADTDNVDAVTKVIVRNNTGAAQLVIAVCRWRIIKNAAAQFGQGQIAAS